MPHLSFSIASLADAARAAKLFAIDKDLEWKNAVALFDEEFSLCEASPDKRIYILANADELLIAYAGARFYGQQQDDNMYGTAQLLPTGWYLRGIKVHPEWRRAGLARELTRRRLDWLSQKTKEVFVFLDDESKVSLPMYHEFGFKLVSKGWEFLSYEQKREDQRGILLSLGI